VHLARHGASAETLLIRRIVVALRRDSRCTAYAVTRPGGRWRCHEATYVVSVSASPRVVNRACSLPRPRLRAVIPSSQQRLRAPRFETHAAPRASGKTAPPQKPAPPGRNGRGAKEQLGGRGQRPQG
jgi:hypothetical protein